MNWLFRTLLTATLCTACGCIVTTDDAPASLTIGLQFEEDDSPATRLGPDRVTIRLFDVTDGGAVLIDEFSNRNFEPGTEIEFIEVGAGVYELSVEGLDSATGVQWESGCADLVVDRFDETYNCDVLLVTETQ